MTNIEAAIDDGCHTDVEPADIDSTLMNIARYVENAVRYEAADEHRAALDELTAIIERAISCHRAIEELPS